MRSRIDKADRFHGSEPERVDTARRHDLDGKAALEIQPLVDLVQVDGRSRDQGFVKDTVLLPVHRTVDVIISTFAVARRPERLVEVDRLDFEHGAHRVVEIEVVAASESMDGRRERVRSERACCDDDGPVLGDRRDLLAHDVDRGRSFEPLGDGAREKVAVDCEGLPCRNTTRFGRLDHERAEPPHLLFEKTVRVRQVIGAQRVAANELGKAIGAMDRRRLVRPHLE